MKVDLEIIRFINGDQAKISRMGVLVDVLNQYTNSTEIRPNEVAFASTVELVSIMTVQLFSTNDGALPLNLKLEIMGCFNAEKPLSTKAQIEDCEYSIKQFISFDLLKPYCSDNIIDHVSHKYDWWNYSSSM